MEDAPRKINKMMSFLKTSERGIYVDGTYLIYNRQNGNWINERSQAIVEQAVVDVANEKLFGALKESVRFKIRNDLINESVRRLDMPWCMDNQ